MKKCRGPETYMEHLLLAVLSAFLPVVSRIIPGHRGQIAVVRVKSKTVCQVVFCRRHTIPVEFRIGCSDTELKLGFGKF